MKYVRRSLMLVLVALLAACSQQPVSETLETQWNSWQKLGSTLDVVTKNNAVLPQLLLDRNGKLVVVWAEDNGCWYLQAKRWNSTTWEKLPIPVKSLPPTAYGKTRFDVAFDNSNTFIMSQYQNYAGTVQVYRSAGSYWASLGSFTGLAQLETNASGQIHVVVQNKTTGENIVKRWNGSAWQTVATFKQKAYVDPNAPYLYADSFALRTDGKPVLEVHNPLGYGSLFYTWTGSSWQETTRGRYVFDYALNTSHQLITATSFYASGTELEVTGTTQDAGLFDGSVSLALRNNQPVLLYYPKAENYKLTAKLWTGSSWMKLAGRLERDLAKVANESDILVDKQGNIFVVWQEAACKESATCGGGNIYVSQYRW
jgi:hypothetical protein